MAMLLMSVVLKTSNHPVLFTCTGYFVGVLIALYVLLFSPISGFSINPARTFSSGVIRRCLNRRMDLLYCAIAWDVGGGRVLHPHSWC
jgi:glycerol uptake facilitator-like aquaporin